jgi:predicted NBD/HSP70 family sugar kinase
MPMPMTKSAPFVSVLADHAAQRLRPRGSNQVGMGQFNERVVLQAIRLHGALPQAEIARLTHLTAQTVSLILARLETEGLVLRLAPIRGKVGQPSVPIALNPDGAFSIGVKIGRQSLDSLLVDFTGKVRERLSLHYSFPDPDSLFGDIDGQIRQLRKSLKPAVRERLNGIGVAAPLSLGGWQQLLGIAPELARKWQDIDIRQRISSLRAVADMRVEFVKDTAAACVAELVAGRGRSIRSFLYIFVDTFIGGGLVLDSQLRSGVTGNAGAVGSLPLGLSNSRRRAPSQLLSTASLWNLEALYVGAGLDAEAWADERALQPPWLVHTRAWLQEASGGMALAVNSAACLLDLEGVIIDGSFGRSLLDALLVDLEAALDQYSWEGVSRPAVMPGTIGSDARAIGGALLPLYANYAPDRDLFLKMAQ